MLNDGVKSVLDLSKTRILNIYLYFKDFPDLHAKYECDVEEDACEWHDQLHFTHDSPVLRGKQLSTAGTSSNHLYERFIRY